MVSQSPYWLWPQTSIEKHLVTDDNETLASIESFFSEYYHPFHTLYFSRARIGLSAILSAERARRPDLTFCQPFSSHCVLSAIAETSTPSTTETNKSNYQIVYHQWGEKVLAPLNEYPNIIIEDAVDSLITTNQSAELFPNNAPYCLVSLPKILSVPIGAMVICQKLEDKEKLMTIRDQQNTTAKGLFSQIDRPIFQENIFKAMPRLVPNLADKTNGISDLFFEAAKNIRDNLDLLQEKVSKSRGGLSPKLFNAFNNQENRLPSNVILSANQDIAEAVYKDLAIIPQEPVRTYFDYTTKQCERVFLLPTHHQVKYAT